MGNGVSLGVFRSFTGVLASVSLCSSIVLAQTERFNDPAILEQGRELFAANCTICHGDQAQGTAKDWHQPDANGKYPPPPLNGTAHTWHHTINALGQVIRNGTLEMGGTMPAWKNELTDDQIFSIIMYLSSLWPDEIYQAWIRQNQQ